MSVDENKVQSNGLTVKENGLRLLAVLYAMSDGREGVSVTYSDLMHECARVGVFKMSDAEFQEYRQKVIDAAHVLDAEIVG